MKLAVKYLKLVEASVKEQIKKMFKVDDDAFEKSKPEHCVCSIVKTKDGWAGFSHRAVHEFKVGDMLFDEKWRGGHTNEEIEKMAFRERGETKIATMEQAKEAAKNFARYVS